MVAKQLSIFLENKSGRLTEVTEVLAKEGVNLSALCISENADFVIHVVGTDDDIGRFTIGKGIHVLDEHAFIGEETEHFRQ